MRVVIDLCVKQDTKAVLGALKLPPSTPVTRLMGSSPFCKLGKTDRAVFFTNLESGGMKYQLDLMRQNPGVEEWIVVSPGTERETLDEVLTLLKLKSRAVMCATLEEAREALGGKAAQAKTCLVTALTPAADDEGLRDLLRSLRPGWRIECGNQDPAAFSRVILAGCMPGDFAHLPAMEGLTPVLALTGAVHSSPDARAALRRRVCAQAGLQWSDETQRRQIYLISTACERWRMQYEGISPSALCQDESFVMTDAFNLPMPAETYREENIAAFLSGFDGCRELAQTHLPE